MLHNRYCLAQCQGLWIIWQSLLNIHLWDRVSQEKSLTTKFDNWERIVHYQSFSNHSCPLDSSCVSMTPSYLFSDHQKFIYLQYNTNMYYILNRYEDLS